MKKFLLITIFALFMLVFVLPANAQLGAATQNLDKAIGGGKTGLVGGDTQSLGNVISTVVKAALSLVGSIFLLLTVYAGILWMTASGKEEQIETAKKIVTAAIIGLFITMAAYAITFFVTNRLSNVGNSVGVETVGCCTAKNDPTIKASVPLNQCNPDTANWTPGVCK